MILLDRSRQIIASIFRREYVANVARLTTGAGLAQCIAFATTPILTRCYLPSEYGLAGSYAAIVAVLGPIAALRYDSTIVLPEADREAALASRLSMSLATVSALLTLVYLAFARSSLQWFGRHPLGLILFIIPLSMLANTFGTVVNNWANRKREYKLLAHKSIIAAILTPAIWLSMYAMFGSKSLNLILATLIGTIVSSLILARGTAFPSAMHQAADADRREYVDFAKRYRQFPTFNLGMTFFDQLTANLPALLFLSWFSKEAVAYFTLANGALRLPMSLIGQAVAQVFYERAARQQNNPTELRRITVANIKYLALLALLPVTFISILGPWIFPFVFGAKWLQAGYFARFLVISTAINLISSPISTLPTILHLQHIHLIFAIVTGLARLGGLWLGKQAHSSLQAVIYFSAAEAALNVVFLAWLLWVLKRATQRPLDAVET